MDCADYREQLEDLATSGPDFAVPTELQQHLNHCVTCQRHRVQLQEAWLLLSAALEKPAVDPDWEARTMQQIESEPRSALPPESLAAKSWKYALAASVLIATIVGLLRDPHIRHSAQQHDRDKIRELAVQMDRLEELENTFGGPQLRYVSIRSVGPTPHVQGYFVYDLVANQGHFFGLDLERRPNHVHVLWLLDAEHAVVGKAAVEVGDNRLGGAVVTLPAEPTRAREIAVTLETVPDGASPSEHVVMRAEINL